MVNMEKDTALHDAARNGHVQIAELLIKEDPELALLTNDVGESPVFIAVDKKHVEIAKLILEVAPEFSLAGRNKMNALHAAVVRSQDEAREGERVILQILANRYPEMWDLQDNNGQTILHLAVARGKLDSVKFILNYFLSDYGLLNQQDNKGNTALHLAIMQIDNRKIFELLIKDRRVDKTITNMAGLAVFDLLLLNKENKELGFFEKNSIALSVASKGGLESLEHAINKNGIKTRSIETTNLEQLQQQARTDKQVTTRKAEHMGPKRPSYEQIKSMASINLLVTTLIATVSFAAGFTVPGGYRSDGPDAGMAILSRKSAFRVFVITNALAFCFSCASMFLHYFKSFVEKLDALAFYTYMTTLLTSYAITALVMAFISGTYVTLGDTPGLAKAVLSIGCSFFGLQLIVYFK
ncbi:hypothetical protein COLO4_15400 [Corchorus olitorius]|uniref:PGG domain-containing protein n=1 Tax=Corchorus olitorius TaxID=93759 RepID=A0A1R3JND3_9ROSI|nr:hypothetical protein COLO4_15400 [Corchorus olitorius]